MYASKREPPHQRAIDRADRLGKRVGGGWGAFDGEDFPPTYRRLEQQYEELQGRWLVGVTAGTAQLLEHLTLGRGLIAFLSAMAEDERHRILHRCREGTKAARAKAVRFGRKPKLSEVQRQEARRRLAEGQSAGSIGKILGVHHATVLAAA